MASVEQRRTDWRVIWRQDGEKQYELFPTRAGAEKFRLLVEAHGGRWPYGWVRGHGFNEAPSSSPTFADWAERAISARSSANDRTRHDYLRDARLHLIPTFGPMPVDRITRLEVGEWQIALSRTLSAKSVKNVHNLASSIMTDAMLHGHAAANPFQGTLKALPSVKQEEMTFLTRGEFETLLAAMPEWYRPLAVTLAHTGLRWSEATALRVGDVDLMARRLTVVQAWKRTPENFYEIGEPKSRRSRRTLVISSRMVDAVLPLAAGRHSHELLFTTQQGHSVRHNNFRARAWVRAIKTMQRCPAHAAALEPCGCPGTVPKAPRIHDLRHSHASWLIADKVSLPAIQRRLGHESITTTIDRYGHLMPEANDEIAVALEAWSPNPQPGHVPRSLDARLI